MSDWKTPNLEAVCGSFLILTGGAVALRFYVRYKNEARFWVDDWLMLSALVTFIGSCVCIFIGIHYKDFGVSSYSLSPAYELKTLELGENLLNSITFISYANQGLVKLSALFFYKRLFDVPGIGTPLLRVTIWTSVVVVILWLIAFEVLFGFQCGTHYSALWGSFATHDKYCIYSYPDLEGAVITDVILDIWVILLPIPWVIQYVLSTTRRIFVCGLFLLSLVGLAASIARMVVALEVILMGEVKAQHSDPRRIDSRLFFYFTLESGMAIIAINLPVIAFTIVRMLPEPVVEKVSSVSVTLGSFAHRSFRSLIKGRGQDDSEESSFRNVGVDADSFQLKEKANAAHSVTTNPRPSASDHSSNV